MQKSTLNYLNDLPFFIKTIDLISTHGRGKGGGEIVIKKITEMYDGINANSTQIISSTEGFLKRFIIIYNSNKTSNLFFTAGIRDIDLLFFSIIFLKNFNVYVQVPYYKSIDLRKDVVHFFLVKVYMFLIKKFSNIIFINSSATVNFNHKKNVTLLPIFSSEIVLEKIDFHKINKKKIVLGTAFRLNFERGIGSKDTEGLIKMCIHINEYLIKKNVEFEVLHFGEFDIDLVKNIKKRFEKITFSGYTENWFDQDVDAFFFLSNYEGFGLAPLEASSKKLVFVNSSFPLELFSSSPNIYPINDLFKII